MAKTLLIILAALSLSFSAYAMRNFPTNAQTGELRGIQNGAAQVGDKIYRLTPATRIYDTNNLIVLPVSAPQSGRVAFVLDAQGFLSKIWVLTPQEAAQLMK
jgi:hypothetical protein